MSLKKLCICKMCNCGRHKCPHVKRAIQKGPCSISEYAQTFVAHKNTPVQSCKPPPRPVDSSGKISSDTTQRMDFIPHPLNVRESCRPKVEYDQPTVTFDTLSTYNKEYTGKQCDRAVSVRPSVKREDLGKFEGEPTYKSDYRQWDVEPRRQCPGKPGEWVIPTTPFGGTPTYTSDYVRYSTSGQFRYWQRFHMTSASRKVDYS